jgi:hypothetical protein
MRSTLQGLPVTQGKPRETITSSLAWPCTQFLPCKDVLELERYLRRPMDFRPSPIYFVCPGLRVCQQHWQPKTHLLTFCLRWKRGLRSLLLKGRMSIIQFPIVIWNSLIG